jgi:hypothetical protein
MSKGPQIAPINTDWDFAMRMVGTWRNPAVISNGKLQRGPETDNESSVGDGDAAAAS